MELRVVCTPHVPGTRQAFDPRDDEFMRLVPIYRDLREKIRSGKIDPAEMDFETVKPMIEFQALERIMDLLVNDQEDNDDDYYISLSVLDFTLLSVKLVIINHKFH